MKQVLMIEASPRGEESASRRVSATLRTKLQDRHPGAKIITREIASENLPHLDGKTLKAIFTGDIASSENAKLSDRLTDELLASDLLVIATPMYNFGVPSTLKAWLDLVIRARKTFRYTETGAEGLAKGKKAILIVSSGGVFSEGPWKAWDYVEPYLRQLMQFIGIEDVQTIRVQGLNIPSLAPHAVGVAEHELAKLQF